MVATEAAALECIYRALPGDRNYYELLDSSKPCLAYFDIDLQVEQKAGEEYLSCLEKALPFEILAQFRDFVGALHENGFPLETIRQLRNFLFAFIQTELLDIVGRRVKVRFLDASGLRKFSIHIHTDLVLEANIVEGNGLACELNRRLLHRVWKNVSEARRAVPARDQTLAMMLLLPNKLPLRSNKDASVHGIFDCSVYSRNRLFRLFGNCKRGSPRFLQEWDSSSGEVITLPTGWRELAKRGEIYLIQRAAGFGGGEIIWRTNPLKNIFSSANAQRAYTMRSAGKKQNEGLLMPRETWENEVVNIGLTALFTSDGSDRGEEGNERNRSLVRNAPPIRESCFAVVLSTEKVFVENDRGDGISAGELQRGQVIHCRDCDLTARGEPDQRPSAVAIQTDDLDIGYYCFSCQKTFIVRHTVDYEGFKEEANLILRLGPDEPYFSYRTLQHLFQGNESTRVLAVNARMGTGKTEAVKNLLRTKRNVLVLTYRQTLAKQLAQRFEADLYLRESGRLDSANYSRVVVCVDSLLRVDSPGYDYVVLDEAGFIRRHFLGRTMRDKRMVVYERLGVILNHARAIIMLQDGLTDADIEFYTLLLECGDTRISKVYVEKRSHLKDALISFSLKDTLAVVHDKIKQGKKVFLPVALKKQAVVLYDFIITYCRPEEYRYGPEANNGTQDSLGPVPDEEDFLGPVSQGVSLCDRSQSAASDTADEHALNEEDQWLKKVCLVVGIDEMCRGVRNGLDFIDRYTDFDVAIATSVLETGVSLENHFTDVIGFFTRIPLPHRSQVQLVNRVRNPESMILYAERGLPQRHRTNKKELSKLYATEVAVAEQFISTFVDVQSECADVLNNNNKLWVENWGSAPLPPQTADSNFYKLYLRLYNEHRQGVRKYLQEVEEISTSTFTSDFRASLIREEATLQQEGILNVFTKRAVRLAKELECSPEHLRRVYWRTTLYFMLEIHTRTPAAAQLDTEWSEMIASSGRTGNTKPFDTIALVQIGRRLMTCLFGSPTPKDKESYAVSDETYPQLLGSLKDIQQYVGARNYTHAFGLVGGRIRDIRRAFDENKSINKILKGMLDKTTPFTFNCRRRCTRHLHGFPQEVRSITVKWPIDVIGIVLGGAKRPRRWGYAMKNVREAIDNQDAQEFRGKTREWCSEFTAS